MAHGKAAARDLRYGRRGGGWKEENAPARPDTTGNITTICRHCKRSFRAAAPRDGAPVPAACGKTPCYEQEHWTPADWTAKADLALIRRSLAIELSALDEIALARVLGEPAPGLVRNTAS